MVMKYPPQGLFVPPGTATVVIAAADSPPRVKAQADVVCPGANDAAIIQAAINSAVAGMNGAEIYFHAGNYYPETSIQIPASTIIRGAGKRATWFRFSAGCHGFIKSAPALTTVYNISIRDLEISVDNTHYGIYGYGFWYAYIHRVRVNYALCGIWMSGNEGTGFVGAFENLIEQCHFYNCVTGIKFTGVAGNGQSNNNTLKTSYFTIDIPGGIAGSIGIDCDIGALNDLENVDIEQYETGIRVTDNASGTFISKPWLESNTTDIVSTVTTNLQPLVIAPRMPITVSGPVVIQSSRAITRYNSDSQSVAILENSDYTEGNGCPDPECEFVGSIWYPGNAGSVVAEETSIVKRLGGKSLHVSGNTSYARAQAYIKNPQEYQGRRYVLVSGWCYQPAGNPDPSTPRLVLDLDNAGTEYWLTIGAFATPDVWTFVREELDLRAYTDIRWMRMYCASNYDGVANDNHAYFWGLRISHGRHSVYYPEPNLRVHPTIRFPGVDHFRAVRAADPALYGNAVALDGALPINLWPTGNQPDVPRTLVWSFISHVNITAFTIVISGIDARGNAVSRTVTEASGWSGSGGYAFSRITGIQMTARTGTGAGDTIDVGTGSSLGLSKPVYTSGDVYKVTKNNVDYPPASYTVSVTSDVVNVSTGAAIVDGDDFTIWYRSTPVPLG